MILTINLEKLHIISSLLTSSRYRKEIESFFKKKGHRSQVSNCKPGSKSHAEALQADEKMNSIPDYNISTNDTLIVEFGYEKIEFTIGKFTQLETDYEGDVYESTHNFLVYYSFGPNVICDLTEFMGMSKIQEALLKASEVAQETKWLETLQSIHDCYELLLERVIEGENSFKKIALYEEAVHIGKDVYLLEDLKIIFDSLENKKVFYNQNGEKQSHDDYREDYISFYKRLEPLNR